LQVLLPKHAELVGKMVTVKIVSSSKYSMNGEPLQKESPRLSSDLTSLPSQSEMSVTEVAPVSHHLIPYTLFLLILAVLTRLLWLLF
jgi:hypothetical protein